MKFFTIFTVIFASGVLNPVSAIPIAKAELTASQPKTISPTHDHGLEVVPAPKGKLIVYPTNLLTLL
jgi:hypothetical protein